MTPKALKAELEKDNFLMLSFSVAKELGMTVTRLWREATRAEILGWSCYFQIVNEEQQKAMDRAASRRR